MIINVVNKEKSWGKCGTEVISEINKDNFGVKPTYLKLVCLFGNTIF